MSPLANLTIATFGASTFQVLQDFINTSCSFGETLSTTDLLNIFDMTRSVFIGLPPMLSTAAGAACVFTATGIWTLYRKFTKTALEDEARSKIKLLQLIKKAYFPECAQAAIEEIDKQNVNINERVSASGLTFFLCGCLSGNADLIKHMLMIGADVNAETVEGDTALYLATYAVLHSIHPNTDTLCQLIEAGCKVNQRNKRGYTPLHRAASRGNIKVIQFLMLQGADPYIANNAGVYPIDSAICAGHIEAAKLLQFKFENPYVWDVVEPHTPPFIKMGLQSPQRRLQLNSARRLPLRNVFT